MTTNANERRRTLVVLPDMQKQIIKRASLLPAIALVILGGAVALHCSRVLAEAAQHDVDLPGLRLLLPSVLAFVIAMAGLLARQAAYLSNRVGGPAYRLIKTMREVRTGNPPKLPVKLREGDYLVEVADELNEFIDWAREQRSEAAEMVDVEDAPSLQWTAEEAPDEAPTEDYQSEPN